MYYIKDPEDSTKIIFTDGDLEKLTNTLLFRPDLTKDDIIECGENETVYNFVLMTLEEKEAKVEEENQERINKLKMTKLDLMKALKSLGVTSAEIKAYLAANEDVADELEYCDKVYCGVVRQLCPIVVNDNITITEEMVIKAFEDKAVAELAEQQG